MGIEEEIYFNKGGKRKYILINFNKIYFNKGGENVSRKQRERS